MLLYYLISGICLFSLADCIGNRKVHHQNYFTDRSRCDACNHPLAFHDLVPIVSYIFLKGKCRYCGKSIPVETLIMEILGAAAGVIAYSKGSWLILLLIGNLALISLTDLKSMDVYLDTVFSLAFLVFLSTQDWNLIERFSGMISIPALMGIMNLIKKESFGLGDLEVCALMGWYLGFPRVIIFSWLGCVCGCLFFFLFSKRGCWTKDQHFCLIPFLSFGYIFGILFI